MDGGEICDEGEECLENLELYVDALRHAVVHRLNDGGDGGEGDGAEGDEALERAEGDGDHLGIFRRAAHKDRAKEVFGMPAIWQSVVLRVARERRKGGGQSRVGRGGDEEGIPELKLADTRSGEDLRRAMDFSAAYL
jgi:hypothetical protein